MTTLCLNMIVRDEERVIERCLESVRPFIDSWLVVDTGSTDRTPDLVRTCLDGLPGELVSREWRNFAANRTEAIGLAAGRADYLMVIDADEILEVDDDFQMPRLEADCYSVLHAVGGSSVEFWLPQIFREGLPWRYEGVVHEALVCDEVFTTARLEGLRTRGFFDSARNADPTAKYLADAELLEGVVAAEPDNARAVFYLAQSYRDAGLPIRALRAYQHRCEMGGWEEEVWYSLFQIAVILERLGASRSDIADAYLDAWQRRPQRAESLCELARFHRLRGEHERALLVAEKAAATPYPGDELLFLDASAYTWRALDELSLALYSTGRLSEARETVRRLLEVPDIPAIERSRIEENLRWMDP